MVDYSKWDHIEVSDDEDDTHPNVDTPSLFRWRHQARVERMTEQQNERESFEEGVSKTKGRLAELKRMMEKTEGKERGNGKNEKIYIILFYRGRW